MKRINPIYLLIGFNILFFVLRGIVFPESGDRVTAELESFLQTLGVWGYVAVVGVYLVCAFFFIPLLIPLNIAGGALYGAYVGTAVAIVGVVVGCLASTISVRYVFKGMQGAVGRRPSAMKALNQISRHGSIVVILIRLAFVIPYLFQNIVLAMTSIGAVRLAALTAIGALPGAAIYSFLGAGLVEADDANELALYLGIPLVLLVAVSLAVKRMNRKYDAGNPGQ